jgi:hypothetical protein
MLSPLEARIKGLCEQALRAEEQALRVERQEVESVLQKLRAALQERNEFLRIVAALTCPPPKSST